MTIGRRGSIFESMRLGVQSEEQLAIETMFPFKDKFKMLQATTEIQLKATMPWSILGYFRRKYKSEFLKTLQEEHNINKISLDRKGRLELSEIVASIRKPKEREEE